MALGSSPEFPRLVGFEPTPPNAPPGAPPSAPPDDERRTPEEEGWQALLGAFGTKERAVLDFLQQTSSMNPEADTRSFFQRTAGAGTRWGVTAPAGEDFRIGPIPFKLWNPLKAAMSGLDLYMENVVRPNMGFLIAPFAPTMAEMTGAPPRDVEQMRETIADIQDKHGYNIYAAAKEIAAGDGYFAKNYPTEMFILSILGDPLNYVGFGLMAKIPILGTTKLRILPGGFAGLRQGRVIQQLNKVGFGTGTRWQSVGKSSKFVSTKPGAGFELSLGAVERGYIEAVNYPFRKGAEAYKRLPRTRGQVNTADREMTHNIVTQAFEANSPTGKTIARMLPLDGAPITGAAVDVSVKSKLLSQTVQQFRRVLFERAVIPRKLLHELATALDTPFEHMLPGYKGGKRLLRLEKSTGDLIHEQARLTELTNAFVVGELQIDEAASEVVRMFGAAVDDNTVAIAASWLEARGETIHQQVRAQISQLTPQDLRSTLVEQTGAISRENIAARYTDWQQARGLLGATVGGIDTFQRVVYQNTLRAYVIRPTSAAVLAFPGYAVGNVEENFIQQVTGRGGFGYFNFQETQAAVRGYSNVPSNMVRSLEEAATPVSMAGLVEAGQTTPITDFITRHYGELEVPAHVMDRLKWFNPFRARDASNIASQGMRNKYTVNRAVMHIEDAILAGDPGLRNLVYHEFPLDIIAPELRAHIQDMTMLQIGTGSPAGIRELGRNLGVEALSKREARTIAGRWKTGASASPKQTSIIDNYVENTPRNTVDLPALEEALVDAGLEDFIGSIEGAKLNLDASLAAVRSVDVKNVSQLRSMIYHLDSSVWTLNRRVEEVNAIIMQQTSGKMSPLKKQLLHDRGVTQIEGIIKEVKEALPQMVKELEEKEVAAWGKSYFSRALENDFNILVDAWETDPGLKLMREWTGANPGKKIPGSIYRQYYPLRDAHWKDVTARRMDAHMAKEKARNQLGISLGEPEIVAPKIKPRDFKNKPLRLRDVAYIVGTQSEHVSKSILSAQFMNRDEFVGFVMRKVRASAGDLTGVSQVAVGDLYDGLVARLGLTDKVHNAFTPQRDQIEGMIQELKTEAIQPKYTAEMEVMVGDYLDGIAGYVEDRIPGLAPKVPPQKGGGVAGIQPTTGRELGRGTYFTSDRALAQGYAEGRLPIVPESVGARPRTGTEVISEFSIPRNAKIFAVDDTLNPALRNELRKTNPRFREVWTAEFEQPTQRNIWDAAQEASVDLQGTLEAKGFKGASRPQLQGQQDFAIWDQSLIRPAGEGTQIFRGAPAAPEVPIGPVGRPPITPRVNKQMQAAGQKSWDTALADMREHFPNFDELTVVDEALGSIFPYTPYEMRRIPWLARQSLETPIVWNMFSPEGRYWDATDDGYIHGFKGSWLEVNMMGGTAINLPRRMYKGQYPPMEDIGTTGWLARRWQQTEQVGFYAGVHKTILEELLLPLVTEEEGDLGQLLPPAAVAGLSVIEASKIPVVSDIARKMRNVIFSDRFRERRTKNVLNEMGLPSYELDTGSFTPVRGAKVLTQEDINKASARVSWEEWVQASTGNVKFRGDDERKLRDLQNEFYSWWLGVDKETVEEYRRNRVWLSQIKPLPPQLQQIMAEFPGAEGFSYSASSLFSPEKKRISQLTFDAWQAVDRQNEVIDAEQVVENDKWRAGEIQPHVWRKNKTDRGAEKSNVLNTFRGRRLNRETGELEVFNEQAPYFEVPVTPEEFQAIARKHGDILAARHPLNEMMNEYYSIRPIDRDGDGELDWDDYHAEQDSFVDGVENELRPAFQANLERNMDEIDLARQSAERNLFGDYWNLDDNAMALMGVRDIITEIKRNWGDDLTVTLEKNRPEYKLYTSYLRKQKRASRLLAPEFEGLTPPKGFEDPERRTRLDYALNIFGFTSTLNFLNPIAAVWWEEDGRRPNLARLESRSEPEEAEEAPVE